MDRQELISSEIPEETRAGFESRARALFEASSDIKRRVMDTQIDIILHMAAIISSSVRQGGKVLFCGNGGSAADAQHLATELLIRLRPHINREGVPALALALDPSSITACGNDYGFEVYYERLVRTLGRPGDVLVGISTSGRSANIVRALKAAREKGMAALGMLGAGGGPARAECDIALVVDSDVTGRIQESHITIGHALLETVEDLLLESGYLHKERLL